MLWALCLVILATPIIVFTWILRKLLRRCRPGPPLSPPGLHVAFFHPYCNAGGGGERVLWTALLALIEQYPQNRYYVYTGDPESDTSIRERAYQRFQLHIPESVRFVRLRTRRLLEAYNYPVLTLLGQSLGSVVVGLDALSQLLPDVYIDSMGYAFTLPIFRLLGGCRVAAYIHYPTVSSDMLQTVASGEHTFNNSALIAKVPFLRHLKVIYYRLFALMYRIVGAAAEVVMVNGSWTRGHIVDIWRQPEKTVVVFPPVDTTRMQRVWETATERSSWVLSVAQFRPEKDHALQLRALSALASRHPELGEDVRLVMAGGCRDGSDRQRVDALKALAEDLGISDRVDFEVNISLERLLELYGTATVGLHTMKNEHFGIGVVEMMAAGLLVVAHNSGGPLADIVETRPSEGSTGFLAATAEEYADAIAEALRLSEAERQSIRERARLSCDRFSERLFEEAFLDSCRPLLESDQDASSAERKRT